MLFDHLLGRGHGYQPIHTIINAHEVRIKTLEARTEGLAYICELVLSQHVDGLVHLQLENVRLHQVQRSTIDLDKARSLLDEGNGCGGFLQYQYQPMGLVNDSAEYQAQLPPQRACLTSPK